MKRNTVIALFVFGVLLVAVWSRTGHKSERGMSRLSLAEVDTSRVDRIVVSGENPVELLKEADVWTLAGGRAADLNAPRSLLEAVEKIESSDLVTSSADRFVALQVDSETGVAVELHSDAKSLTRFIIGKAGGGGSYVRVDDAVYLVKGVYRGAFSRTLASWQDRRVFRLELNEVARVDVQLADQEAYTLTLDSEAGSDWQLADASVLPEGFRFDSAAARSFVSALTGLRVEGFVDEPVDVEMSHLDARADIIVVHTKAVDGQQPQSYELRLGAHEGEEAVYGSVAVRGDTFTIAKRSAVRARKLPAEFRDMSLMAFESTDVVELAIVEGRRKLVLKRSEAGWAVDSSTEVVPEGFEIDPNRVMARITMLEKLRGTSLTPLRSKRLVATLTGRLADGTGLQASFGRAVQRDGHDYVVAVGNVDSQTYLVEKAIRDRLVAGLDSFRYRAPNTAGLGNIDPAALANLPPEIREQLLRQLQQRQLQEQLLKGAAAGGSN